MVTDEQLKKLMKMVQTERTFGVAADKAGMDQGQPGSTKSWAELPGEV